MLHSALCGSELFGLFLIERCWIVHIGPSSSESWAWCGWLGGRRRGLGVEEGGGG